MTTAWTQLLYVLCWLYTDTLFISPSLPPLSQGKDTDIIGAEEKAESSRYSRSYTSGATLGAELRRGRSRRLSSSLQVLKACTQCKHTKISPIIHCIQLDTIVQVYLSFINGSGWFVVTKLNHIYTFAIDSITPVNLFVLSVPVFLVWIVHIYTSNWWRMSIYIPNYYFARRIQHNPKYRFHYLCWMSNCELISLHQLKKWYLVSEGLTACFCWHLQ